MRKNNFLTNFEVGIDAHFLDRLPAALATVVNADPSEKLTRLLRDLSDDLDSIRNGRAPDKVTLAAAPLLKNRRVIATPDGLRLTGCVDGHPLLGSRQIVTSPVWALNTEREPWARTLSRFYTLGEPAACKDDGERVSH